jgi:similar to spore coat protein
MNPILENMTGTAAMTDEVVASDLLISAKSGVRNYAIALTEAATDEVRVTLRRHLEDAIHMHEQVSQYMMDKEWYHVYDASQQLQHDIQNANTTQNMQ